MSGSSHENGAPPRGPERQPFSEHVTAELEDERPPVLRTWRNVYLFVLIYLAALIILFWLFTEHYKP